MESYKRVDNDDVQPNLKFSTTPLLVIMVVVTYSFVILLFFNFAVGTQTTNDAKSPQPHHVHKNPYFQMQLDHEDRFRYFWSLDYKTSSALIEVRIKLRKKYDWFAVGFSDYGNITNADLCILWFDLRGKTHFTDASTDEDGQVRVDMSNNCQFVNLQKKGDSLWLIFKREFDTCDPEDYKIEEGTTHIVYATGRGPLKKLSGMKVSTGEHGFIRTRFLRNLSPVAAIPEDAKNVVITNNATKVPPDETTYWCSLHELPGNLASSKHHVIQYESVVTVGNEDLVHHMEVFHCEVNANETLPHWNGLCFDPSKPAILETCKRVIAAWAMGAGPLSYPAEAGLPIGGPNFSRYVMLEIHYNNPLLRSNVLDSSGIKFVYTPKLRENDVGVLEVGLEYTDKNSIPPKEPSFDLSGFCVSECTRVGLPVGGITIFASQLHTHLTGVKVATKHVRGGQELPEINRDNHYSQHFQEIRLLKNPVLVLPGDALITTCTYDTRSRGNMTLGGHAISMEMCVNYIHYYPKSNLEVCKSSVDTRVLDNFFRYMKQFEGEKELIIDHGDLNQMDVSHNYKSIRWSAHKSQLLSKLYHESPLSMQCNQSSGDRFPGNWEGIPVTQIYDPLKEPLSKCNSGNEDYPM